MTSRVDRTYNVNVRRLALLTIPTWLRKSLAGALVFTAVAPIGRLLSEVRTYRNSTRYRLRHNGQVCKLRGVLNDELDPEQRRIAIEDGNSIESGEASSIWCRDIARWVMLPGRGTGAATIHREGFGGTGGYDFWVTVPEELRAVETRLRAIVNMYKLASKRYAINYK